MNVMAPKISIPKTKVNPICWMGPTTKNSSITCFPPPSPINNTDIYIDEGNLYKKYIFFFKYEFNSLMSIFLKNIVLMIFDFKKIVYQP